MPLRLIVHVATTAACVLVAGCASAPETDVMIQRGPNGAVYIERVLDPGFQAAHPITLEREVVARTLRGVYVRGEEPTLVRVFSDSDIEFLAPLIATGLSRAASDQRVGFRVGEVASATTEAILYAYGTSLHLTLTKYRGQSDQPDDTVLKLTEVLFYPTEARRPEGYQPAKLLGEPLLTTLVIDYQLLAKLPSSMLTPPVPPEKAPKPAPSVPPPAAESGMPPPAAATQDQQATKDLETIKSEMEDLRRQMQKQQEEMEKLKQPKKP